MSTRRRRLTFAATITALIGCLVYLFVPIKAIRAIASLSDPSKLATLGERATNPRLNKIVYWLDQARRQRMAPEMTVNIALTLNGTHEPRFSLVKESLLRNLKIADELGLLTRENREELRRGQAAIVTRGPFQKESVEIDHIVPRSLAPELDNELANLEMLPKRLNRKKSDHVGERQLAHAQKLLKAGLLKPESYDRVRAVASKP